MASTFEVEVNGVENIVRHPENSIGLAKFISDKAMEFVDKELAEKGVRGNVLIPDGILSGIVNGIVKLLTDGLSHMRSEYIVEVSIPLNVSDSVSDTINYFREEGIDLYNEVTRLIDVLDKYGLVAHPETLLMLSLFTDDLEKTYPEVYNELIRFDELVIRRLIDDDDYDARDVAYELAEILAGVIINCDGCSTKELIDSFVYELATEIYAFRHPENSVTLKVSLLVDSSKFNAGGGVIEVTVSAE